MNLDDNLLVIGIVKRFQGAFLLRLRLLFVADHGERLVRGGVCSGSGSGHTGVGLTSSSRLCLWGGFLSEG